MLPGTRLVEAEPQATLRAEREPDRALVELRRRLAHLLIRRVAQGHVDPGGMNRRTELIDDRRGERPGVGRDRQRGRDPLQALDPLARRALAVPGRQQLTLVELALGRVEDRRANDLGRSLGVSHEHGVDEHGEAVAVRADDVDGDLADRALQPQHRRIVRLVVDPTAHAEQVLEALDAHELLALIARPLEERRVDPEERPVRRRREIAAGRVLEQVLGLLVEPGHGARVRRTPGWRRPSPQAH
jgi:hypothetical protein